MEIAVRAAVAADIPALRALIDASVRGLQRHDYTPEQIECALTTVYGVDTQLIADGTYFVAYGADGTTLAGCGGWSKRAKLYGGDHAMHAPDRLLNPLVDAAKIRAFFVHPDWSRRGIGGTILARCEAAARTAGFERFEIGATLTGVALYSAHGYVTVATTDIPLRAGLTLRVVHMVKPDCGSEPRRALSG